MSDQNTMVTEGWRIAEFGRDVLGRTFYKYYNDGAVFQKYGYTSNSSSPDVLKDENNNILEKYVSLPGLLMTIKTSGPTTDYSIMSSTGNVLAKNTGTIFRYDPFGVSITNNETLGFGGSQIRQTEKSFTIEFIQMGARVYIPTLGRFLQVDPIEGGTQNDYVYPNDPVNVNDFSGQAFPVAIIWGIAIGMSAITSIISAINNYNNGDTKAASYDVLAACGTVVDLCDGAAAIGHVNDGNYAEAAVSGAAIIPIVGSPIARVVRSGLKYTKSSLSAGQAIHRAYKMNEVVDGLKMKEYTLPSGKRIDFIDLTTNTVYELKPFNPRSLKRGEEQLKIYEAELKTIDIEELKGREWNLILEAY